jgi:Spy/CpxP family protein refolding chaperone
MLNRYTIIMVTLIAIAVSGNTAIAQDSDGVDNAGDKAWGQHRGPGRRHGNAEEMLGRMAGHLDLDDTQSQAISNIMEAAKPEFESLRARANVHRQAIRALDTNDADYGTKLQNQSAESGELAAELTQLTGRIRGEVHAVLTPEQQQKLASQMQRMGARGSHGPSRNKGDQSE